MQVEGIYLALQVCRLANYILLLPPFGQPCRLNPGIFWK